MSNKTHRARASFIEGFEAPKLVDTEVATNVTANLYRILPVNCTAAIRTVTPPVPTKTGDWFTVVDSRANANNNNITIDFSSAYKFQGSSADLNLATAGAYATFVWSGSTAVGWLRIA